MINSCCEETSTSQNDFNDIGVRRVPRKEFINNRLTLKLARQIQDVLAIRSQRLPLWCHKLTKECPFLFSFETRHQYFYLIAFGSSHALFRLQQQQGADSYGSMNESEVRIGTLKHHKILVPNSFIFDSAVKVMKMHTSQESVLEVICIGGVDTGLEPTLNFYTLLSDNLKEAGLGMWRLSSTSTSDKSMMKVDNKIRKGHTDLPSQDPSQAPLTLFPRPYLESADVSGGYKLIDVAEHFRLLGRVLAKVLQDGWILDLPLSSAFYKLLLGQDLDMHDIISFDAKLGKMLLKLKARDAQKSNMDSVGADLQSCGYPHCSNTLPDYPDYTLKTNVDINSMEEYICLVVKATIKSGIETQLKALKEGFNQRLFLSFFSQVVERSPKSKLQITLKMESAEKQSTPIPNDATATTHKDATTAQDTPSTKRPQSTEQATPEVFDISSLEIFSPKELECMPCNFWEMETLMDHIKIVGGYTAESPPIVNLFEILREFNP